MPHGRIDGIFGYRTMSSVRLFQEYVRSVGQDPAIGNPDGIAGSKTQAHLKEWIDRGDVADWTSQSSANPSAEYQDWLSLLQALKSHHRASPSQVLRMVAAFPGRSDTRPVTEWDFSPGHIHLIGIRRGTDESWKVYINNDVFILLVNGLVFTFFGATDPNPHWSRADQPYLVPGQHLYRFGWHKVSDLSKAYRGFRPATAGVLVVRDSVVEGLEDVLDEADLAEGIDQTPNPVINIHWSGRHTSSWSAGCQVISGGGYINHHDDLIDCWEFAAPTYGSLPRKTRGAYNVLLDLITVFTEDTRVQGGDRLHYVLIDEEDLVHAPATIGPSGAQDILTRGLEILAAHDPAKANKYASLLERSGVPHFG